MKVDIGWSPHQTQQAVELYEQAFGRKIAVAIPSRCKRLAILHEAMNPDYAFTLSKNGQLLALMGFQNKRGGLTSGISLKALFKHLGWLQGLRALMVLCVLDRPIAKHELVLDGIAVLDTQRGKGLGSILLCHVKDYIHREGYRSLRLDVVNTNPRAKALYLRHGFKVTEEDHFPAVYRYFGFSTVITMKFQNP